MEKKLSSMFEYQLFEPSKRLAGLIKESMDRVKRELSDEELGFVAAAGEGTPVADGVPGEKNQHTQH